jgi:hypothetical protein
MCNTQMNNICILLSSFTVSILSVVSMCLLFGTISGARHDDLKTATLEHFTGLGTCISTPLIADISNSATLKADWNCHRAGDDQLRQLSNLLSAATHSIYYAQKALNITQVAPAVNVLLAAATGRTLGAIGALEAKDVLMTLKGVSVPSSCDDIYQRNTMGVPAFPEAVVPVITCSDMPVESNQNVWSDQLQVLHAHCVRQFSFGASGPASGSLWIPVYGVKAGPTYNPTGNSIDTLSLSSDTNARLFIGQRFGATAWAYSVLILALGFCFLDGMLILISDGTESGRMPSDRRTETALIATKAAKRDRRWAILLALLIASVTALIYFLWVPFRMGRQLGRPRCDSPNGWESDVGTTRVEIFSVCCLVLALALPFMRSFCKRELYKTLTKVEKPLEAAEQRMDGSVVETPNDTNQSGWIRRFVLRNATGTGVRVSIAGIGVVLLATAFAISGSVLGSAWSDAVIDDDMSDRSVVYLSGYIWRTTLDSLYTMMFVGMIIAAIQGRWLVVGYGICSNVCVPVLTWALLTVIPVVGVVTFIGMESFTDESPNCKLLKGGFAARSCTVKWVLLVIGATFVLIPLTWSVYLGISDLCVRAAKSDIEANVPRERIKPKPTITSSIPSFTCLSTL